MAARDQAATKAAILLRQGLPRARAKRLELALRLGDAPPSRAPAVRTRAMVEAEFLARAAELAGLGASEMDLRELLDDEAGCLERAGRRRGR